VALRLERRAVKHVLGNDHRAAKACRRRGEWHPRRRDRPLVSYVPTSDKGWAIGSAPASLMGSPANSAPTNGEGPPV
jgi:hypothetical protein